MAINRNNIIDAFRGDDEELNIPKMNPSQDAPPQAVATQQANALPPLPDALGALVGQSEATTVASDPSEPGADWLNALGGGQNPLTPQEINLPTPLSVETGTIGSRDSIAGQDTQTITDVASQEEAAQRQAQKESGQQIVGATDDGALYGNYLPTLFEGASANDLADTVRKSQQTQQSIFESGAQRDLTTSAALQDLKAMPQDRSDPTKFRPDSTQNPFEAFGNWLNNSRGDGKDSAGNELRDYGSAYGKGFIGGALYFMSVPFSATVGAFRDANTVRNNALNSIPGDTGRAVRGVLDFNPLTALDKWVNRDVPGHKPLTLFNDNGANKDGSYFINALRGNRNDSFSSYRDEGVIGIRDRNLGLKWYKDPTFWAGMAADVISDPGDVVNGLIGKVAKRFIPPKTARAAMGQAMKDAAEAQAKAAADAVISDTVESTARDIARSRTARNMERFVFSERTVPSKAELSFEARASNDLLKKMEAAGLKPPSVSIVKPVSGRAAAPEGLAGVKPRNPNTPDVKVPKSPAVAKTSKTPNTPDAKNPFPPVPDPWQETTAVAKTRTAKTVDVRIFKGELTLDEFATQLTKPTPGQLIDPTSLVKNKRTLEELSELARKVPGVDGLPLLQSDRNFTTWRQLTDKVNSLGDDTYRRIFDPYGAKIDLANLASGDFNISLPDGTTASYIENAYPERTLSKGAERAVPRNDYNITSRPTVTKGDLPSSKVTGLPDESLLKPKVVDQMRPSPRANLFDRFRAAQKDGIRLVREGKVSEGSRIYDDATSQLGKPSIDTPEALRALNEQTLPRQLQTKDPLLATRHIEIHSSYQRVSEEANHLSIQLRTAQEAKDKLIKEVIENEPDLGRRYPDMSPSVEGATKAELPVVARVPELGGGTKKTTAYQGTRVLTDDPKFYTRTSPIDGGTRAELGTAHYFSSDPEEAAIYALADSNRDLPNIIGRAFGDGNVKSVSIDESKLLDFNSKPTTDIRQLFVDTAINLARKDGNTGDAISLFRKYRGAVKRSNNYKALYSAYDDALTAVYGIDVPAEKAYRFSKQVNAELVAQGIPGYKGSVSGGATHYAILDGKAVGAEVTGSGRVTTGLEGELEIAGHRYNADSATAFHNPQSKAEQIKLKESAVSLQDSIVQDLTEKLHKTIDQQDQHLSELMAHQDEMIALSRVEKADKMAEALRSVDSQTDDTMRHLDKPNDSPCVF